MGFAHCHTDELPIVLGLVLIMGGVLGALAPRMFPLSWPAAGAPVFVVETLVHFHVLSAPYPASAGIPFVALFALVPAAIGVAVGAGLRWMLFDNGKFA